MLLPIGPCTYCAFDADAANAGGGVALSTPVRSGVAVGEGLVLKAPLLPFVRGPFCNGGRRLANSWDDSRVGGPFLC